MTACECFFPDSGDSFVIQRDPAVLPPDNATLRLAEYAARDIATVQRVVGPLFARATDNESLVPTEANIVDLGSGTGVLGIAAVKKVIEYDGVVASLTAVEIDEGASDNTTANYRTHINHPYPAIKAEVLRASWDEERVWDAIANADVILCNPPYLIPDDSTRIRKGFESVNPIAMYVPTDDGVFSLYRDLLARSLTHLKPFGSLYFRLPKYEPSYNDSWAFDLQQTKQVRESLVELSARGLASTIQSVRYEPYARTKEKIGNDTIRHLHVLTANLLPETYPFMSVFADPAYVHFQNSHELLSDSEYQELLHLAGYPNVSGGGFVVGERMLNFNYPKGDSRYIDPGF